MAKELVESSNISSREFLEGKGPNGTNIIRITFKNGRVYDYSPVPKIAWLKREFYDSPSKWLNECIKANKEVKFKEVRK